MYRTAFLYINYILYNQAPFTTICADLYTIQLYIVQLLQNIMMTAAIQLLSLFTLPNLSYKNMDLCTRLHNVNSLSLSVHYTNTISTLSDYICLSINHNSPNVHWLTRLSSFVCTSMCVFMRSVSCR